MPRNASLDHEEMCTKRNRCRNAVRGQSKGRRTVGKLSVRSGNFTNTYRKITFTSFLKSQRLALCLANQPETKFSCLHLGKPAGLSLNALQHDGTMARQTMLLAQTERDSICCEGLGSLSCFGSLQTATLQGVPNFVALLALLQLATGRRWKGWLAQGIGSNVEENRPSRGQPVPADHWKIVLGPPRNQNCCEHMEKASSCAHSWKWKHASLCLSSEESSLHCQKGSSKVSGQECLPSWGGKAPAVVNTMLEKNLHELEWQFLNFVRLVIVIFACLCLYSGSLLVPLRACLSVSCMRLPSVCLCMYVPSASVECLVSACFGVCFECICVCVHVCILSVCLCMCAPSVCLCMCVPLVCLCTYMR